MKRIAGIVAAAMLAGCGGGEADNSGTSPETTLGPWETIDAPPACPLGKEWGFDIQVVECCEPGAAELYPGVGTVACGAAVVTCDDVPTFRAVDHRWMQASTFACR